MARLVELNKGENRGVKVEENNQEGWRKTEVGGGKAKLFTFTQRWLGVKARNHKWFNNMLC